MTTKSDIYNYVHARTPLSRPRVEDAVDSVFHQIKKSLKAHENVVIRKFGEFRVLWKAERVGLNPRTREHVPVSERHVVSFRAGQLLKEKVNDSIS